MTDRAPVVTSEIPSATGTVYGGIAPYLMVSDATAAAAFYARALGAEEVLPPVRGESGKVMNHQLKINGGTLMIMDPMPEYGHPHETHQGYTLHLQLTGGIDAVFDRAVAEGCTVIMPLALQFWGDRYGQFKDPFGVSWSVGEKP